MALKIWLQFKSKLHNSGTEKVNISNVEKANIIANGKVGGALATTNLVQCVSIDEFMPIFSTYKNYSCSAWVFIDDAPTGHSATIFSSGDWNAGKSQCCFGLSNFSGGVYNTLLVPNTYGWSTGITLKNPIALKKWYHIAITYDGNATKAYINGKYNGIYNGGGITSTSNSKDLYIGKPTYANTFNLNGLISDVRIYDKALSVKEINEISKGLLLNYSFNENINIMKNAFKNPTFNGNSDWYHWGGNGHIGTFGLNEYREFIYRKDQRCSHWVENDAKATSSYLLYQSPDYKGGYRSMMAILKESNGLPINENICYPAWNADNTKDNNKRYKWTSITYLENGFYLCKCEGFSQDGSNNLVGIYVKPGHRVYFSEMYLEDYREVCSNPHFKDNIISDNSGLFNYGKYVGNIETVKGSANGNTCYYWGESTKCLGYIQSQVLYFDGENCTLNAWIKLNGASGGGGYHMPLEGGDGSTFEMSISADGKLRGGIVINGTRYVQNCTNDSMYDKKWHMITITYDGSYIRRYVDGKEFESTTIKGKTILRSNFYIGQYGTNASYYSNDMYESDVRIYATALSLEDIKQMYKVRTAIDNKNNLHSFQFNEENENLLKREYTIENCNTPRINSTCGTWGKRNGINCMKFGAPDYYFGADDARNSKMLLGHFEEGEQYVFDLWLDVDDLVSSGKNVVGGFIAIYTDGTTKQLIATGDATNKKGFQHIHYVSTLGKTLKSMSIYYYVGTTFYVRWDSSIVKYSGQNIGKNGVVNSSMFVENIDTNENVKFFKGGVIKTSELDKI